MEMLIKMVAMGVSGGPQAYLCDYWNRLDCFIVLAGGLEYVLDVGQVNFTAIRTVRVLRPLRAINRIPSMRILVTLLLDTLPMLGNVLLLCFFVFFIFGIIGVQLWSGLLRQRCFISLPQNMTKPSYVPAYYRQPNSDKEYLCSTQEHNGLHRCQDLPPLRSADLSTLCQNSLPSAEELERRNYNPLVQKTNRSRHDDQSPENRKDNSNYNNGNNNNNWHQYLDGQLMPDDLVPGDEASPFLVKQLSPLIAQSVFQPAYAPHHLDSLPSLRQRRSPELSLGESSTPTSTSNSASEDSLMVETNANSDQFDSISQRLFQQLDVLDKNKLKEGNIQPGAKLSEAPFATSRGQPKRRKQTRKGRSCINWNKYYTECRPGDQNPFQGTISFDNVGMAWTTIFLVISLEGWSDIMYLLQDSHSFWVWIYFVLLIVIGSFFMINLCLVVIATQFSATKKREMERMRQERLKSSSSSTLTANSESTNCYTVIVKYVAHSLRRLRLYLVDFMKRRKCKRMQRERSKRSKRHLSPVEPVAPIAGPQSVPVPVQRDEIADKVGAPTAECLSSAHEDPASAVRVKPTRGGGAAAAPEGEPRLPVKNLPPEEEQMGESASSVARMRRSSWRKSSRSWAKQVPVGARETGAANWAAGNGAKSKLCPSVSSPASQKNENSSSNANQIKINPSATPRPTSPMGAHCWPPESGWQPSSQAARPDSNRAPVASKRSLRLASPRDKTPQVQQPAGRRPLSRRGAAQHPANCPYCLGENDSIEVYLCPTFLATNQRLNSLLGGSKRRIRSLVDHRYFQRLILLAILINAIAMGIEYHNQPQELTEAVEISNILFAFLFLIEMILKLIAHGLYDYVIDGFNCFDGCIVIISILELFASTTGASGLSVLRTFRLLRILKLVRFMPALKRQLVIMLRTLDNVAVFFGLLVLFIFIFSILGMNLFGCKFCETLPDGSERCDRKNFNSLLWSLVTVFQILTQEDWNVSSYIHQCPPIVYLIVYKCVYLRVCVCPLERAPPMQ